MSVLGVDWYAAATHSPGVGRYGRELVRAWLRLEGDVPDVSLYEVGAGAPRLAAAAEALTGDDVVRRPRVHLRLRVPRRAADLAARAVGADGLLRGCTAFLRSDPTRPVVRRARTVFAIDSWPEGDAERERFAAVLRENDEFIVFAHAAADRLVDGFGVGRERVHVTCAGSDHWLRDATPVDEAPSPRTLLVLGAVSDRRAPVAVLEAFERLRVDRTLERMVVCGRAGDGVQEFESKLRFSSARSDVEWVRDVREQDLPARVRDAAVLVHVGAGEATAVTPLEAFAFGVPAVVSDLPEMREVLGDLAHHVPRTKPRRLGEAVADAVRAALDADTPATRAARRARAAESTWSACAAATAELVRSWK
ncbi:MAG: glycosyltransferase [Planctomycetota bacterium]